MLGGVAVGSCVGSLHRLCRMWLSTVKWSVASVGGKVDVDTTIGRAKVLEFLFGDSVGSLSLSRLTKPISCSQVPEGSCVQSGSGCTSVPSVCPMQVLCLTGSGVDVTSSLVPSRPCCKVKYTATAIYKKVGHLGSSAVGAGLIM